MPGSRFKRGNPGYSCCPVDCDPTCFHVLDGCGGSVATGATVEVWKDGTCGEIYLTVLDCDTGVPLNGFFVSLYEMPNTILPISGGTTNASGQVTLTGFALGATVRIRTAQGGQGDWTTGNIGPIACNATITIRHQTDPILGACATGPSVVLNPAGRVVVASGTVDGSGDFCADLSAYVGQTLKWDSTWRADCFKQPNGIILGNPCGREIDVLFLPDNIGTCFPYHCGTRFCCSACPDCTIPGRLRLYDTKYVGKAGPPFGTTVACGECPSLELDDVEVVLQYHRLLNYWVNCDPTSAIFGTGLNVCYPNYRLTCEGSSMYLEVGDSLSCSWQNYDAYGRLASFWRCCVGPTTTCAAVGRSIKVAHSTLTCNPFSATFVIPELRASCWLWTVDPGTGIFSAPAECVSDFVLPERTIVVLPDP